MKKKSIFEGKIVGTCGFHHSIKNSVRQSVYMIRILVDKASKIVIHTL